MAVKDFTREEQQQVHSIIGNIKYCLFENMIPALSQSERYNHDQSMLERRPIFSISRVSMMPAENSPIYKYAEILCNKQYHQIIEKIYEAEDINGLQLSFKNKNQVVSSDTLSAIIAMCVEMREELLDLSNVFKSGSTQAGLPTEVISQLVTELERLRLIFEKRNNYFFFAIEEESVEQTAADFANYLTETFDRFKKDNPAAPIASYHKKLQQELRSLGLEKILFEDPYRFSGKYLEPFLRQHADSDDPGSTYMPGAEAKSLDVIEKNIDKFDELRGKRFLHDLTALGLLDADGRFFSSKPDMSTETVKYAQALLDSQSIWTTFKRILHASPLTRSAQKNLHDGIVTINEFIFPLTFATRTLGISVRLDHSITLYDRTIESHVEKNNKEMHVLVNQLFGDANELAKEAFAYLIEGATVMKSGSIEDVTIKAGRIPFLPGLDMSDSQNTATRMYENCKLIYEAMYYDYVNLTERLKKAQLIVHDENRDAEAYRNRDLPSISLRDYHLGLAYNLFQVLDFVEYLRISCLVKRVTPKLARPQTGYITDMYKETFSFFTEGNQQEILYKPAREYA